MNRLTDGGPRQVQLGPRRPLRQRNVDAILAPFVVGMVDVVILAHWFPDVRSPTHAQAGRSGSGDSLTLLDRPETFDRLWDAPPCAWRARLCVRNEQAPDLREEHPPAQGPPTTLLGATHQPDCFLKVL